MGCRNVYIDRKGGTQALATAKLTKTCKNTNDLPDLPSSISHRCCLPSIPASQSHIGHSSYLCASPLLLPVCLGTACH
jgi:hypothetical protein